MQDIVYYIPYGLGDIILTAEATRLIKEKHPNCNLYVATGHRPMRADREKWKFGKLVYGEEALIPYRDSLKIETKYSGWQVAGRNSTAGRFLLQLNLDQIDPKEIAKKPFRHTYPFAFCDTEKYDVIISPRIPGRDNRIYKSWGNIVPELTHLGYSVASVGGTKEEYLPGTVDLTHLSLKETMSAISNCRVFATQDGGLYHFANSIGKDNVAVFSFTGLMKMHYDPEYYDKCLMLNRDTISRIYKSKYSMHFTQMHPKVVLEQILKKLEA